MSKSSIRQAMTIAAGLGQLMGRQRKLHLMCGLIAAGARPMYSNCMVQMDDIFGKLVDKLDEIGGLQNIRMGATNPIVLWPEPRSSGSDPVTETGGKRAI